MFVPARPSVSETKASHISVHSERESGREDSGECCMMASSPSK